MKIIARFYVLHMKSLQINFITEWNLPGKSIDINFVNLSIPLLLEETGYEKRQTSMIKTTVL